MEDIFIKEVRVNKVRHLQKMIIGISDSERKHLMITGKNGSGKTSLLNAVRSNLIAIQNNQLLQIPSWEENIIRYKEQINLWKSQLQTSKEEQQRIQLKNNIVTYENDIKYYENQIAQFSDVSLKINNLEFIQEEYNKGDFIISFFDAKRSTQLKTPNGIQKLELQDVYRVEEKANQNFIQYLVNLKAQRSFARDDNKIQTVEEVDNWFSTFEHFLQEIFEDDSLKLEFDSQNFDFNIIQKNREKFNLNALSDGYSAILNIITELIVRMEKKSSRTFELQGIVLIDEIETHLHIELQKLILPFLIKVFPKIQFIVTTHSPFVLNSISNSVIFDLENQILVSDLSGFSIDGIVEGYFESDKYSIELKNLVEEYEILSKIKKFNEVEEDRYSELKRYFKDLPKFLAPELSLKIMQIELSRLGNK
jgi:predicted ATP-binding protein involved in virulence